MGELLLEKLVTRMASYMVACIGTVCSSGTAETIRMVERAIL